MKSDELCEKIFHEDEIRTLLLIRRLTKSDEYNVPKIESSIPTTLRLFFSLILYLLIVIRNGKIVWKHGSYLAEF